MESKTPNMGSSHTFKQWRRSIPSSHSAHTLSKWQCEFRVRIKIYNLVKQLLHFDLKNIESSSFNMSEWKKSLSLCVNARSSLEKKWIRGYQSDPDLCLPNPQRPRSLFIQTLCRLPRLSLPQKHIKTCAKEKYQRQNVLTTEQCSFYSQMGAHSICLNVRLQGWNEMKTTGTVRMLPFVNQLALFPNPHFPFMHRATENHPSVPLHLVFLTFWVVEKCR